MNQENRQPNHLINEKSPYLLQHAYNPVDWYPWGEEAFTKAKAEDKPIFLSIGYSTCHWCHVMAHESFEDEETAKLLNQRFVSIKVDKEERPDIDSVYMAVCQALTGSGGWPTSIFMTSDQTPFFAGTYFPKIRRMNEIQFMELLTLILDKWENDRKRLLQTAMELVNVVKQENQAVGYQDSMMDESDNVLTKKDTAEATDKANIHSLYKEIENQAVLLRTAVGLYQRSFDRVYGGFGNAPKFPTPHNLLFLLTQYEKSGEKSCLDMVEKTLTQMYRGGIFDHIGYGFSRYSTDRYFLVPHFEKMLYDNALLLLAYCKTYDLTKMTIYKDIAEKTASFILKEMTSPEGGFYCALDADSEGEEGKFYVFQKEELLRLLGDANGEAFAHKYDITEQGNFEGRSIPNLLKSDDLICETDATLAKVYEYRRHRHQLHLDDKILTSWNSLMIAAMCWLYRITRDENYLDAAKKAREFIEKNLCIGEELYVSFRENKCSTRGFLDDYSYYVFSLIALYEATLEQNYLERAQAFCRKAISEFWDTNYNGFFLYGNQHETLIMKPKETYDGALPSGNSIMAYNLTRLQFIAPKEEWQTILEKQMTFLGAVTRDYPAGHAMYLIALSDFLDEPMQINIVMAPNSSQEELTKVPLSAPLGSICRVLTTNTKEYPLKNEQTTFYVCKNRSCMPPTNSFPS